MARSSTLLAFVRPSEHRRAWVYQEAEAAACEVHFADTLQSAILGLAARRPAAVIADMEWPECEALCEAVRSRRREVDIAVFGVADRLRDEVFASALRRGLDDLVAFHADGSLSARVVSLPADPSLPPPLQGDALVAVRDRAQATKIGRTLTNAGYEVEYATEAGGIGTLAMLKRVRLVATDARPTEVRTRLAQARAAGSRAIWVVLASGTDRATLEQALQGLERVAVVNESDPTENVLFVSNDVAAARRREFRIEPRLLYGTLVAFRSAGDKADDFGFAYNVSPAGLYVRTLAPPLESVAWIELCPPGSRRRVRLEGEVVWRRAFGRFGTATAPPGFAVRIMGGLAGDREAWAQGCGLLVERLRAGLELETPISDPPAGMVSLPPEAPLAEAAEAHDKTGALLTQSVEAAPETRTADEIGAPTAPSAAADLGQSRRDGQRSSEPARARRSVKPPPLTGKGSSGKGTRSKPPRVASPGKRWSFITWSTVAGAAVGVTWMALRGGVSPSIEAPAVTPVKSSRPRGPALSGPLTAATERARLVPSSLPEPAASVSPVSSSPESNPDDPPGDPAKLLANEGYLRVASSRDTLVFVHAIKSGNTNSWLRVPCGWRWVRLGQVGGYWESEGASVYVTCRGTTRVTVKPSR